MDGKLRSALTTGVMETRQDGTNVNYHCVVCDKTVSEPGPHLQGKDHYNNLVWYTLKHPSPTKPFLDALPAVVQDAKVKNELKLVDKTIFSYRCLVCPKKNPFTGIKQLEDHLKGKEHEKARKAMTAAPSPTSQSLPYQASQTKTTLPHHQQLPPSSQTPYMQQSYPYHPPNSGLQSFQSPQVQYPANYQPQLPDPQASSLQSPQVSKDQYLPPSHQPTTSSPVYPYPNPSVPIGLQQTSPVQFKNDSGMSALQPDLVNRERLPPEVERALIDSVVKRGTGTSFKCVVCNKDVTGVPPLQEHLKSEKHKKKVQERTFPDLRNLSIVDDWREVTQQVRNDSGMSALQPDFVNRERSPPEVERALLDNVVKRGTGTSFKCVVCNKDVTGVPPLQEHLKSEKHKKKVQQTFPDRRNLSIVGDGREVTPVEFESAVIGEGREDQVDGSWTFPWTVVLTTPPHQPTENVYRNLSTPRGLVLIFNYYFTGDPDHERHGARRDSRNLKALFNRMGYQVYLYEDCSKARTMAILQSNQADPFLRKYDSLIVFVMSHGKEDLHFYAGSCRDEDIMTLDEVRYCFTDISCPALKDKPKLFFVNFCRGQFKEPQTQYDSVGLQQMAPKDMVTIYSCINKFQAPRDPQHGTIFIQVLCEVLAAHAHNTELQGLYQQMCQLMESRRGSNPEIQYFSFSRKYFFNPVQQY